MKVVISLGGIFFADAEKVKAVAAIFDELAESCSLCIVTGGGERAREYIGLARDLGANEANKCEIAYCRVKKRVPRTAFGLHRR
jgi:uridylate kinase